MGERTELKKTYGKFYAVGKVAVSKKNGFEIDVESKNNKDYVYSTANLHLDCGKDRLSFAQLIGGYNTSEPLPFKVFGKDSNGKDDYKNLVEIDWEDRLDEDVVDSVANSNLIIVGLEIYTDKEDNKEKVLYKKFLSAYDAIPYIQEHLVEGSTVKINGNLKYGFSGTKVSLSKSITYISLSNAEPEDFYANFTLQALVDKDSLDEQSKTEDGLVPLYINVVDYFKPAKKLVSFPTVVYIDPTQYKKWDITKKKFQPVKKQVWLWGLKGRFAFTSETVEITLEDLSKDLREQIEEGLLTEEEAFVRAVGGNKSKEAMLFTSFGTRKDADGIDVYDKQDDLYTIDDYDSYSNYLKEEKSDDVVDEDEYKTIKKTKKTSQGSAFKSTKNTIDDDELNDLLNGI